MTLMKINARAFMLYQNEYLKASGRMLEQNFGACVYFSMTSWQRNVQHFFDQEESTEN